VTEIPSWDHRTARGSFLLGKMEKSGKRASTINEASKNRDLVTVKKDIPSKIGN